MALKAGQGMVTSGIPGNPVWNVTTMGSQMVGRVGQAHQWFETRTRTRARGRVNPRVERSRAQIEVISKIPVDSWHGPPAVRSHIIAESMGTKYLFTNKTVLFTFCLTGAYGGLAGKLSTSFWHPQRQRSALFRAMKLGCQNSQMWPN